MRRSVSVVVPVKDGERYLAELLAALHAQADDAASLEILVIDSGSRDASVAIARAAGVTVLEIPAPEFGHGRTRNLGVERTSGELIAFLTQDATPLPGWLAALEEAFDLDPRVGAVYGPHRARADTSPMIARELETFFAGHTPDGGPVLQRGGDEPYLSNVNAAYRRECWAELRFPDVPYSEDQAFARAMPDAGWIKAFHPGAAVLHAHDYPPGRFMQRYFDEYRGLRETIGHTEPFGLRSSIHDVRGLVSADRVWMRDRDMPATDRARWTARAVVHHGGRKVFSALGSRAHSLPAAVQRRLSLEGTASTAPPPPRPPAAPPELPAGTPQPARQTWDEAVLELAREGAVPLADGAPGMAVAPRLHIAVAIPPFRRGSGGHNSIFQMLSRLERAGHVVSVWLHDPLGWQSGEWPAVVRGNINEWFAPLKGPVFKGFEDWYGADVAVATGWQTVYPVLRLPDCRSRAYLVHDHESEFYATSAEGRWAEETYGFGMHAIAASPWLADIVRDRYGGTASLFDFGVDHDVYRPRPVSRRRDTVIFYAREVTPRRAVPLGMLALQELKRRRPDVRIVMFGDPEPNKAPVAHEHLGIASPEQLSWAFSEARVGLCLSMTNYSLIPQEMMACGLPCVDLAGFSAETVFGAEGPVELAPFDPVALADAIDRLLDDDGLWERRSQAGRDFVAERTWDHAAEQLEDGLREALRRREEEYGRPALAPDGAPLEPSGLVPGFAPPGGADWSARTVPVAGAEHRPVTERLLARLSASDLEEIAARLTPEEVQLLAGADAGTRAQLQLAFGVWHGVDAVREKTGLTAAEPGAGVHAMARGPLAAGGDLYSADMVVEAIEAAGGDIAAVRRALDFGCSSGRALRPLAAAWPDVEWHGVDPNAPAVAWASEHVPGVSFAPSPTDPPLAFADGSLDLVYAISIWSHFDEGAGRRWLAEMHRTLAPGGLLVATLHGLQSIAHYAATGERPARQLEQIRRALYRRGFWFAPEFGASGDHGVRHAEWGNAFMTQEWLLRAVAGAWDVAHYAVGRNAGNQDLVVLRRRSG
jgi:glycosyltransferase involved in cell wall biosynthesis/SAM-dependent methyltransferase